MTETQSTVSFLSLTNLWAFSHYQWYAGTLTVSETDNSLQCWVTVQGEGICGSGTKFTHHTGVWIWEPPVQRAQTCLKGYKYSPEGQREHDFTSTVEYAVYRYTAHILPAMGLRDRFILQLVELESYLGSREQLLSSLINTLLWASIALWDFPVERGSCDTCLAYRHIHLCSKHTASFLHNNRLWKNIYHTFNSNLANKLK